MVSFGKEVRARDFTTLDPEVTPINHGSYGLPPQKVLDTFVQSMKADIAFPDAYAFQTQGQEYEACLKAIAEVVKTSYRNLAIVDNATGGINAIFRSMRWNKGDKVVISSVVYPSCENVLRFMEKLHGIEIVKVKLELDDQKILDAIEATFKKHKDVKVCMFDFVSSIPAYLFPVADLVALCKKYDVVSVVDAAHGVGLQPIDLDALQPDFWVSNLHKWYYCPRGTALVYVDPKHHASIQPFPISHEYLDDAGPDTLVRKFKFPASDNSARLNCVAVAKEYRQSLGGDEAIWKYCSELRDKTLAWLTQRWGTSVLGNKVNQMANVVVPEKYLTTMEEYMDARLEGIKQKHYFQVGVVDGITICRLSFQVYNEFDDYVKGIEAFESLVEHRLAAKTKSLKI